MLYITDRHSCWKAQGDSTTLMLPHADVTSAEKLEKGGQQVVYCGPAIALAFSLPTRDARRLSRTAAPQCGADMCSTCTAGGKGSLRISFGSEGEHLVLRDFNGGTKGLEDALALLEHVTSSS